jgi:hypothetical protein
MSSRKAFITVRLNTKVCNQIVLFDKIRFSSIDYVFNYKVVSKYVPFNYKGYKIECNEKSFMLKINEQFFRTTL